MNYQVRVIYNKGVSASEYIFPLVQSITDPVEGMKATIIKGTRGDGAIIIAGGKESQEIVIKGKLCSDTGYADLMSKINEMKASVGFDVATITKEYWDVDKWETTWSYTIRRTSPIIFDDSFQTDTIDYTATFLILVY